MSGLQDEPSWIVSHIAYGAVYGNNETEGCVSWDGLDENGWPVPPGTYGLKGIITVRGKREKKAIACFIILFL